MAKRKLVALKIFGILLVLQGVAAFIMVYYLMTKQTGVQLWQIMNTLLWALIPVAIGVGIFQLKFWSRIPGIIYIALTAPLLALNSIGDLHFLFGETGWRWVMFGGACTTLIFLIIAFLCIYYLTRPSIKEQFK